ncbi:effector-associated constant component EACC1 [Nocardia takedensis]|uniref:effector-associated constant component EACC1 n=1 Tax=Nocardia takedensis TaxID=259390 RepID=UPI003F7671DB
MSNIVEQLSIRTTGSVDDLIDLLGWFRRDDSLRGRVQLETPPPQADQMGHPYQVLTAALSSGGIATALVSALKVWFTARRSDLTVTVSRPDGTTVTIDAKRVNSHDVLTDLTVLAEPGEQPR